jgi:hypothetical protein
MKAEKITEKILYKLSGMVKKIKNLVKIATVTYQVVQKKV